MSSQIMTLKRFNKRFPLTKIELEQMYIYQRLSSTKISKEISMDHKTVLRWLYRYNIPRRPVGPPDGELHPFYGKNHTQETKRKISISKKGKLSNSPTKIKKGQHLSLNTEFKEGMIPKSRKVFLSRRELEQLYLVQKLSCVEITKKLKISSTTILRWLKRYNIPRRSLSKARELACLEGRVKFCPPTRPELRFMDLCQRHNYPFKYTGDGSFWIGYPPLNPDFIHLRKRIVIEIFGDYWHRYDDPQERVNAFKNYGWDCLVFWEHELKELKSSPNNILNKIKELINQ